MIYAEPDQLEARVRWVTQLLGRRPDRVTPSPRALGYRARVRFKVGPGGTLGYHRPRSHEHVLIPECAIARPEINRAIDGAPAMPPGLDTVELRADGARVVWVARSGPRAPRDLAERLLGAGLAPGHASGLVLDGRVLAGEPRLELHAGGITHRPGAGVFFQVNLEINAALVEFVARTALAFQPAAVLDLYAGFGNLSLPIAAAGVPVSLWESDRAAIADARRAVATLPPGAGAVQLRAEDVGRFQAGDAFFDVAILDPPRAGAPGVLPALLRTRPRALIYVACDPHALARDLQPAWREGYALTALHVFEMFPQTPHVETVAVLERA